MKEAYRVFSKSKRVSQMSPSFRSTVHRGKVKDDNKAIPGPGQYEVTLPLVKPKFEAIFKNNKSIIIKVNDNPTAAFISRQPRFKQYGTLESETSKNEVQEEKAENLKNSRRYNFSLARKSNNEHLSSNLSTQLKQDKKQRDLKGSKWSKYTVKRNLWNNSIREKAPGPGSYYAEKLQTKRIFIPQVNTSWQFKSITKRSSMERLDQGFSKNQLQDDENVFTIHNRANI